MQFRATCTEPVVLRLQVLLLQVLLLLLSLTFDDEVVLCIPAGVCAQDALLDAVGTLPIILLPALQCSTQHEDVTIMHPHRNVVQCGVVSARNCMARKSPWKDAGDQEQNLGVGGE
jgi:hypothetical protein